MRLRVIAFVALVVIVAVCAPRAQAPTAAAVPGIQRNGPRVPVEIVRDQWGIPHVFAATDAAAFYGLGYATAEDRALQMTYTLRVVQGRLSEVVGEVRHLSRNETSVDNDRKMRTFGFYQAAVEAAAKLDPETRALLEAYSDGVNACFAEQAGRLHPLFEQLGLKPEPWTPADCLASWWHFGQFFATDGTRELITRRNRDGGAGQGPVAPAGLARMPPDEAPAVVQRSDVSAEWVERVKRFADDLGVVPDGSGGEEGPRFSHAWVVGGSRTTTGSSVLVSDPQTPVRNPSLLYEFHVAGRTFDARGVGVAGSPVLLIGFTPRVAWGVTALGADQADLFLLDTDPARPDQYRFDGAWRPMSVRHEVIRIKGQKPIDWTVRSTHLGPVATSFCFARPDEGEVALKRIPMAETSRETIQGALAMMRATNAREFDAALAGWRFPSANMIFGDRQGAIGYRAVAAVPIRSRVDAADGRMAMPGRVAADDWRTFVPPDLLPGVVNPAAGFLYSGNHRPIGSWYPIPIGIATGAGGDTTRSWRLRERLEGRAKLSPEAVLAIHSDAVNPARREIVRVGLHLRDRLKRSLPDDALRALTMLGPWHSAGASSSLASSGAEVAMELNTFFRFVSTELAFVYGGGESGLAYFLKTIGARLDRDPGADVSALEEAFIAGSLASAWQSATQKYGPDPAAWNRKAREAVAARRLGSHESLDGFPSLDRSLDVAMPPLTVVDGGTIASQAAQSYTQFVPMHDPDQAMTVLPIGQSERPGAPSRTVTMKLWAEGRLHPAPLSRVKVEALAVSRRQLMFGR
jgi:penicillin G amidase